MQSTDQKVEDFARSLNEDIRTRASEGIHFSTEIECFAETALELLGDSGVVEDAEVCVRQGRIGRVQWAIGGWASPPSDEEDLTELSVLALLFNDSPEPIKVDAEELRRRFEGAVNFVAAMIDGHAEDLEPAADAAGLGRLIYDRRGVLRRVIVHLVTDGLTQRLKSIGSVMLGSVEVACEIWDIERLSRLTEPTQEDIDVDVRALNEGHGVPCLPVPENDPHYDAFLCVVPGLLLARAYEQYGQRLLELNVRAFLSITGKVNKGIRETIRSRPERFFPYNNGLAMTARRVEVAKRADGQTEITRIVGLQIVNGGQTTASIHRAWKIDKATDEASRVFVQGKLTVITTDESDDEQFVELVRSISRYANSQNAVKDDDLEANQPWHVTFEKLSRTVWAPDAQSQWFYERARGSYATAKTKYSNTPARKRDFEKKYPRSQVISKTDLAKAWNAWSQRPEIVSLGGQKNFKHFMAALGTRVHKPVVDESEFRLVVGRVILYRETTRLVNSLKERIPAFRAQVVAYLIAYLGYRLPGELDFERVWNLQRLPDALEETLLAWAEPVYRTIVTSAASRNVGEWCKKADCWRAVRELDLPMKASVMNMVEEQSLGDRSGDHVDDQGTDVSEVMRVTLADWRLMQEWVAHSNLYFAAPGIIASMYRMALAGWKKRPTGKQARAARGLLDRWRAEVGDDAVESGSSIASAVDS